MLSKLACQADPAGPTCGYASSYAALLGALQSASTARHGHTAIVAMAYPDPWSGTGLPQEPLFDRVLVGSDGRIDCTAVGDAIGIDDVIACLDDAFEVRTVDLFDAMRGRAAQLTHILQGDVHFNDRP